jgi:HK97 family phage portal protein
MRIRDYIIPAGFQKKAGEVQRAIVRMLGLTPQWSERNYENFAKEGYNANVWTNRCIKAIAEGAASVPWMLYQKDSKGELKELTAHPLLDLLEKPNEFTSKQEFVEGLLSFLLISGNGFIHMNGPSDNAPPKELWVLRSDRIKIIPHSTEWISQYLYTIGDQKTYLDRKRVAHVKYFNPLDDFYGLSPIQVAARGIDNDNAANAWNNSLLTNGARPGGALVTENSLSEGQFDSLKNELDSNYRGSKNAGKPMILEGGLKWQEMSLNPRDMEFIGAKKMSILEICAAFGVPPEIVGYGEQKTYSNYQEARKALYVEGVLPNLDRITDKLNASVVPFFGDNLVLAYNKDAIEALQENRDSVYKRANDSYKAELLTRDEAREEMGYTLKAAGL